MKNLLKNHLESCKEYTGHTTLFDGYVQFGGVYTSEHEQIGFTAIHVKKCIDCITSPNYAYSRQKNGYISIYGKDAASPTGVSLIGGIPDELEFLLYAFGKTGQLSPAEDLRTAH